jgi:hypothetical protein
MPVVFLASSLLIGLVLHPPAMPPDDPIDGAMKERFDREFRPAVDRNEVYFSQLVGSATFSNYTLSILSNEELAAFENNGFTAG